MPNEIIRHPRLSSDAVRLLAWALSLPDEALEPLSKTAQRASIGKSAVTRAKRELVAEGFLHEWRRQADGGRWVTDQMISNVPLTAAEAEAVRDGRPSAPSPATGEPSRRAAGRSPKKTEKKTCNLPTPAPSDEPEPSTDGAPAVAGREGESFSVTAQSPVCPVPPPVERGGLALAAVTHAEPRLRLSGRDVEKLAPLAGEWFQRGGGMPDLREALTSGLPDVVRSPAGLVRDRLTRKMPSAATFAEQHEADRRAAAAAAGPRVAQMRECAGEHVQPRLFRPVDGETLCPSCRCVNADAGAVDAIDAAVRGGAAVRELLRARRAEVAA